MIKNSLFLLGGLLSCIGATQFANAGVVAYTGPSTEKLFIEDAPKIDKKTVMIQFTGITSKWADKVIRATRQTAPSGDRFSFEYEVELSSGIQKKNYTIVVEAGSALRNGSLVKKMLLYYPEMTTDRPMELVYDRELTLASQKLDLVQQNKKSSYKPDPDDD